MRPDSAAALSLPLEQVLADENFNVRVFFGDIDQLAVQLMTEGQLEPIKVRRDGERYFVVDGHRRHRAFHRARELRIEGADGRHVVFERDRPLREAPGPAHADFDPGRIRCRLVDPAASEAELFASQLFYNSGKPFTLLERMLFLSRLHRSGAYAQDQIALRTGFSRTHVANARSLNAADPRLLDYVRQGRVSQKLALRLLRSFPPADQLGQVEAAARRAGRHHRDKILPKDFSWGAPEAAPAGARPRSDPVRARLHGLVARMGEAIRFPPNSVAQGRLETLVRVDRYALGKVSPADLEAFLLGRE